MTLRALLLAATVHGAAVAQTTDAAPDTLPLDPARDAYLDETARVLMLGARAARDTSRLGIDSYTALIRERIGVEFPTFRRDRPWVNGERAVRVRWSREEPNVVRVLGSRFRHPGIGPGDSEFFPGLRAERYAADPLEDPFAFGFGVFMGASDAATAMRSPLESGSERHYQFRSGDTISVQLAGGRTLRAVSVTAIPRYRSIRLVSAIMWIDPDSYGLARVAYRLAKKVDREVSWQLRRGGRWTFGVRVDMGASDAEDSLPATDSPRAPLGLVDRLVNGVVNNTLPRMEMDISTVVADYGLWEMRHWLPRSVRWEGNMGVTEGLTATSIAPPATPMTIDWTLEIEDIRERGAEAAPGTPATAAEALQLWREAGDSIGGEVESESPDETVTITPADRQSLATSGVLPPTFWEEDRVVDDATLDEIASALAAIGTGEGGDASEAASPWIFNAPGKTLKLLRYNPVEWVSVGTRLRRDYGWGSAELTARIATSGLDLPDLDLTLLRDHPRSRILVSFYRALRGVDLGGRGSDSPGLYARGEAADFHWSRGAAIRFLPPTGERNHLSLRLFAEQDTDVGTDTRRNRVGASAAWRPWWGGFEFGSVGGGGAVSVRGSAGDNSHVRALVVGALEIPLPGRFSLGMQTGAARTWGDPAPQDLWRIGATGDWLRGHADAVRASRIRMVKVDLQRPVRFLRLSVFGDWASAGGDDFYAVGAGLAFMDGIMRLDVARGLRWGREGLPDAVLRLHLLGDAYF